MSTGTKKKFKVPHIFVILFCLMLLITLLTWIIPAGQYNMVLDEVSGRQVVDPESFHFIEKTPVGFATFIKAIYQGCQNSAGIIFMILLLGAYSSIINQTGAISRGINLIVKKYDTKALYAIPVLMVVLSFLGASAVIVDACLAFIPVGMVIAKKLKLDPLAAGAIIYLGCYAGWNSSFMAATSVQTAQQIAQLTPLSGIGYRFIVYVIVVAFTITMVMRYCLKIRKDQSKSLMSAAEIREFEERVVTIDEGEFSVRDALVILIFLGAIGVYIFGSLKFAWGLDMMVAMMMIAGIAGGVVGGMKPDDMAKAFGAGVLDTAFSAMIVGVASSLAVLMNSANIIHTIIWGAGELMKLFPGAIAAIIMFLVNLVFNFFVPSGPAQAAIVMPIMAPLSDVLGISRQVAVLCFQYGDGFSNSIIPTSGVVMGMLGMVKVPWPTWLKFMAKIFLGWISIAIVAILVALAIGYN